MVDIRWFASLAPPKTVVPIAMQRTAVLILAVMLLPLGVLPIVQRVANLLEGMFPPPADQPQGGDRVLVGIFALPIALDQAIRNGAGPRSRFVPRAAVDDHDLVAEPHALQGRGQVARLVLRDEHGGHRNHRASIGYRMAGQRLQRVGGQ